MLILQAVKVINVTILSALFMIPISHVVPWMFQVKYGRITRRCIHSDALFTLIGRPYQLQSLCVCETPGSG